MQKLRIAQWFSNCGPQWYYRSNMPGRKGLESGSGPEGSAVFLERCHQEFHLNRPTLPLPGIPSRKTTPRASLTTLRGSIL
ncbi:hypothetical protein EYF80_023483 [Liparis tanakae]|uniref:Uncharacterized protein n=1 Tax=Liparis tanakae TaxID=230148 RepID=A0A4Z2HK28_9TELE|nr:hypothetical protein EYF80_023483 [Liparis tanakae]